MKRIIERISSTAMLAVAFMLCATSAWADPVAEWGPGEFPVSAKGAAAVTSTDGTCTLTKNNAGNISTANDLTIKGWPAVVTPSSNLSALTVVVGYKAPSATASGTIVQFGTGTSGNDTRISANLVNGALKLGWQTDYSWSDSNSAITGLNQPNDDAVHFVTLASSESNGTTIRFDGGNKVTASGLKWGSMSIAEITLGAIRGPANVLTDVEYQYIAVYDSVLSDAAALTAYQRAKKAVVCSGTVTPSVDGENNCTFTVTEDAAYNVESAATYNTVTFNVTEGKTLILSGATLTGSNGVTVNGGMVEVSSATALAGTLKGDGTLCYTTVAPSGLGCKTSAWEGTLWIRDYGNSSTGWQLDEFGSSESTLRLTGIQGHLNYSNGTVSPTVELYGTGLTVNNGSSHYKTTLTELTGSGILTVSGGSSNGNGLLIKKVSGFTGSINVSNASKYTVTIGGTTCTEGTNGKLVIASGTEVTVSAGKQFKGAGGIEVNGTMNLVSGCSISGTVTGSGTLVCDGYVPTITLTDSNWTGTLWVKNAGTWSSNKVNMQLSNLPNYGNANSFVKFTNVAAYLPQSGVTCNWTLILEDDNENGKYAWYNNNGWTLQSDQTTSSVGIFAKLKGDGTFWDAENNQCRGVIQFTDVSQFTGSIRVDGKNIAMGGALTVNDYSQDSAGTIEVVSGAAATIASGKNWDANHGVYANGTLGIAGTGSITGDTIVNNTFDLSGFTGEVPGISGALTLASGTTIKLPASATLPYQIATSGNGGLIDNVRLQIGSDTPVTGTVALRGGAIASVASVDINTEKIYTLSEVFDTPSATSSYEINVTSDATVSLDADTTVYAIKFNIDDGKTLKITGGKLTADTVVVSGGGNLAFAVANSRSLARNAVAGAPYRVWPYKFSSLTGDVSIDVSSVEVSVGYSYSVITTSQGLALEFTTAKQFGSLNINFPGGRDSVVNNEASRVSDNASYSGLMHGAAPVVGTSWNDVPAQNATDVAVAKYIRQDGSVASDGTATITLSGVKNPYTTGSNDGDRILFGYCDDGSSPVVTINNIPFAKYRVIAYAATDTGNAKFCPKTINDVSYSTAAAGSSATPTIAGGTGAWGDSNSRSMLTEGVNYLVSDVISGTTTVTINNPKTSLGRAAIPAVQIVEVGVAVDDNTYDIVTANTYNLADIFPSISAGYVCEINVNESATLNIGETSVGAITFNVAAGKTLTISGTVTANLIYVYGEGKVACSAANSLSGAIRGDGRIVFEGTLPPSGLQASLQDGASWTGTVEIKDYTHSNNSDYGIIKFYDYGNANSAIALNGVKSLMFGGAGDYSNVTLRELEIGEGGWSDRDNDDGTVNFTVSPQYNANLTGQGTITVKTGNSGTIQFIGNHTFDGSVTMGANTAKQVAFMKTAGDTIPSVTAKAIVVAGGLDMSIASGKTWTADGGIKINGSLTVLTSEKEDATSGTISAYQDDETIGETVDAIKGTTTYASIPLVATLEDSPVEISDNQASMGTVTVVGASSITGSGGALMKDLTISNGATLTYDPVITPLRVKSAPVFNGTGKLKLAARYAGVTRGKFHLVSYPSTESVSGTLADLVDSSSFASDVSYTVTEETVGSYHQLVLKVGDYDANAKAVSIAQFGDSITEGIWRDGYRGTPNYRIPLMQLLEAYGYRPEARGYRSVGSTDANGVPADDNYKWHTGISAQRIYTGMTSGNLRAGFMESIEAHLEQVGVTDIITLKIGTNDSIGNETADNMFEGWTNLVWKIVRMRPTSKIVVCAPVKIRSGENNAPGLRTKIADYMALTYEQGGFPNGQVTMINGINIVMDDANYYLTDNVHPNWNGHLQLANAWLPAVTNAFESMAARATVGYSAQTFASASAEAVNALADYRAGYVKLATFTNVWTKLSTWGASPYKYVNDDYKDTPMGRVAYFVARKTTASPDTRYVWVDMDADSTTGATLADFGVPTSASVNGVVNNLHIYSNSSAIENVAPTVSGVKGTLMRTEKGVSGDNGIATAPDGMTWNSGYGYDWNDTIGSGSWGVMNMARIFDGATPTDHRKLLAAQMLFDFNGFNGGRQNALGIGDFAVHGPYGSANGSVDYFNINWTFTTAKDDMPTMDVRALETGVIEIWGKQVYTATINSDTNFSAVATSAGLPVDASACDLVINVTANSTLTFGEAVSVGSIRFNIADGVTLTLGGTLNLSGAVVISGPGKLQLSSSGTFGRMDVASSATLGFANGVSLTITGGLWVASGSTLTLEPKVISTSSSTILSAAAISGSVSLTLPTEAGVEYSTINTGTSYKIVRTPSVAFSYDGTIGATPTGWFTEVEEAFSSNLRIGPDASKPIVYEVKDNQHPYNSTPTWAGKSATVALYADISQVANTGKPVLVGIGASGTDNKDFILLYRDGDKVKLAVWNVGVYDSTPTYMVGTPAFVDVPSAGYHLYTATFTSAGALNLYCDSVAGTSGSAERTIDVLAGFQIGNLFKGVANGSWSHCSGDHGLTKGIGMAFAAIRGYDAELAADNVEALAQQFPATDNSYTHTVDLNATGKTLTVYSTAFTGSCYLGVSNGALVIPENNTVSVPHVRLQESVGTVTADIYGRLEVTSVSTSPNVQWDGDANNYKGILFGKTSGSGTGSVTIHSTGALVAPNAWLQTVFQAGNQTITIDGGLMQVKGLFSDSANKSSLVLQNDGILEVDSVTDRGQSIAANFGYGAFRIASDVTLPNKLSTTFNGTLAQPTTLDPYGNTLTLQSAALTGSGDITVADSSGGHAGKVVFVGGSSYTGRLIMTDDNAANIDISGYTGTVLCHGTAVATIAKFNEFAGTVYFTGNVDATGIDLSGATVHIADSCTFTADAGKEGSLVLGDGAAVTLKVTKSVADYDGYIPSVSGNGTVGYYQKDGTPRELTGADHVNGNNLLPYYNVWSASATASENTLSANAAARWKSDDGVSGVLPADDKNVAFKLENGDTVTLLVDVTKKFNDIQVFGNGTLIIQKSDENVMTVGNALYTTANVSVQIDSGLAFANYTKLEVESALPKKVAVNCGTAESPYGIPTVTGSGALQVTAGHALAAFSLTVGNLDVDGALTLYGPSSATAITVGSTGVVNANAATTATTLTVNAGGVVNVAAAVTLTAPTLAVNGTVNMTSTSVLSGTTSLSGAGTVNWNGKNPDLTVWNTCSTWVGTNSVSSLSADVQRQIQYWGRNGSYVKLTDVKGWLDCGTMIYPEIILENGTAGYGIEISNGSTQGDPTYFRKISGSGTLKQTGSGGNQRYVLRDVSDFTGSIEKTDTVRVLIIDATTTQANLPDKSNNQGHMFVANITAKIGDGKGWSVASGKNIDIAGTATVEMLGSASMSGPITFQSGATLKFDAADGTTAPLTLGNNTATWPADGSVTLNISALAVGTAKVPLIKRTGGEITNFDASRVMVVPPTGSPYGASRWTTYTETVDGNTIYGVVVKPGTIFSVY